MTDTNTKTAVAWLPALAGTGLCMGAIGLLSADAITTGHVTVTHALQPLLVLGSVAAAVLAHRSGWRRPLSALAFVLLALLGSVATMYGTMGRQAADRDTAQASVQKTNRDYSLKTTELTDAKANAARECKVLGDRCKGWQARVDSLTAALAKIDVRSSDPRADAIADLMHLVANVEKGRTKAIVTALDPLVLPLFLEIGSILFFAVAFPRRRVERVAAPVTLAVETPATPARVAKVFSRDDALADFLTLKASGSQSFLAHRWQVSEGHRVKVDGRLGNQRQGRAKANWPINDRCPCRPFRTTRIACALASRAATLAGPGLTAGAFSLGFRSKVSRGARSASVSMRTILTNP